MSILPDVDDQGLTSKNAEEARTSFVVRSANPSPNPGGQFHSQPLRITTVAMEIDDLNR